VLMHKVSPSSGLDIQAHPKRRESLLMEPVLWVCQL
jgi:hypothetical protein